MKQIKTIVKDIKEELEGANHYAKLAVQYKDSDKMLADTYYNLAAQEISHVDTLHSQAVRMIKAYQSTGAEVPVGMQAIWDYEHENQIDMMAHVKSLMDTYKK